MSREIKFRAWEGAHLLNVEGSTLYEIPDIASSNPLAFSQFRTESKLWYHAHAGYGKPNIWRQICVHSILGMFYVHRVSDWGESPSFQFLYNVERGEC